MASPQAKGGLGWAILAAALAIPGLLFYNWWSHLKAERHKSISQKARGRVPEAGVFSTPAPDAGKLYNPVAASTEAVPAAPPAPAPAPAPAAPADDLAAAPAAAFAAPAASAPADDAVSMPPVPAAGMGAFPDADASAAVSSASVVVAALPRDPMLSPMDIVRMQQEEMERILADEALTRAMRERSKPKVKKEVPIETHVDLQGIVANPDGDNKAIVNDAVVGVGETIDVRGRLVHVLRITAAGVTFRYKNRRFTKNVSRDE